MSTGLDQSSTGEDAPGKDGRQTDQATQVPSGHSSTS